MTASTKGTTLTDLDHEDWESEGKRHFYAGPSVCLVHDGIPTSDAEDEEWELGEQNPESKSHVPVLFVRLFATPEEKAEIDVRYASPDNPASADDLSDFLSGQKEWVEAGIAGGWASEVLDYHAVSIPVTEQEDADAEESGGELICIHGIRLYTGAQHRDEVRASHSATMFRDL